MHALKQMQLTGASGTAYTLEFGTNAACRLEEETGRIYGEVLAEVLSATSSARTFRAFIRAMVITPANPSAEDTGRMLDDLGGWQAVQLALRLAAIEPPAVPTEVPAQVPDLVSVN